MWGVHRSLAPNILGLKIDVDTYIGMKRGVPRLLEILDRFHAKGTFYLSMGPDSSGRAVFQLLKNPLFFKKMLRTNATRLYGFKTALYGTLLPSPKIALSFPDLVQRILSKGHEVEFHAWDHRRWQDELTTKSDQWIETWFRKGVDAYVRVVGRPPAAFGAPAWMVDDRTLRILKQYSFQYLSCSRADGPFVESLTGLIEIPSDLPCFEEIGVEYGVDMLLSLLKKGGIHILPVHAEAEGGIWDAHFIKLLEELSGMDYDILKLGEIKKRLHPDSLVNRKYRFELLPGRSVPCAI
jgi:undecaprenyl phosphate-alpha-L-ara4FN deformylase